MYMEMRSSMQTLFFRDARCNSARLSYHFLKSVKTPTSQIVFAHLDRARRSQLANHSKCVLARDCFQFDLTHLYFAQRRLQVASRSHRPPRRDELRRHEGSHRQLSWQRHRHRQPKHKGFFLTLKP